MFDQLLQGLSAATSAMRFLRVIGVPQLAGNILEARTGIVRTSGFEFYPDRETMNRFRTLGEVLQKASTIKMILVGGSRIVEDQTSVGNVRKVIFPNPHSRSLSLYADSVNDSKNLPAKIINTTSNLLDKRIRCEMVPSHY
jgi:hypothetical protein